MTEEMKPVHPGELGGRYRPLTKADIAAIDANVFRILEEVGFSEATQHCIETCTAVGARKLTEDLAGSARQPELDPRGGKSYGDFRVPPKPVTA